MSKLYDFIAKMYRTHIYSKEQVKAFVPSKITAEEYKEITGEDYE